MKVCKKVYVLSIVGLRTYLDKVFVFPLLLEVAIEIIFLLLYGARFLPDSSLISTMSTGFGSLKLLVSLNLGWPCVVLCRWLKPILFGNDESVRRLISAFGFCDSVLLGIFLPRFELSRVRFFVLASSMLFAKFFILCF